MSLAHAVPAKNSSSATANSDSAAMPVNLDVPDTVSPVGGVSLAGVSAGLKRDGAKDLVLVSLPPESSVAAVFTRNAYCAAPVTVAREHLGLANGGIRALLINSGGANAATGSEGVANAREHCDEVASVLGISPQQVLPFSTGVIGEQLPAKKMLQGIAAASQAMGDSAQHWLDAARGIMTTDTLPKQFSVVVQIDGRPITLSGFAKGSGMIQPNMATMLAYVFTDAAIDQTLLRECLVAVTDRSFNSITVDGDTSTNDSCVLAATGTSGVVLDRNHKQWRDFQKALDDIFIWLAQSLVRDGEGASKFITIDVKGGRSTADCRQVGLTVGNSPLVKTAFFASDANLGRIIMAIGRSGIDYLDIEELSLRLGSGNSTDGELVDVLVKGQPATNYSDEIGQAIMQSSEIVVSIDLGMGSSQWTCWACDLSHDYVSINADYRS